MLSLAVFIVGEEVSGQLLRADFDKTAASVRLAGHEPIACRVSEIPKNFAEADTELVHFIMAGHFVMPSFYEALAGTVEHQKMDYAFCRSLCFAGGRASVVTPGQKGWEIGGMVVRRWVLQEIGVGPEIAEFYGRAVAEYRGVEVPHVLFVS
jgi:hypothetical protein